MKFSRQDKIHEICHLYVRMYFIIVSKSPVKRKQMILDVPEEDFSRLQPVA